MITLTRCVRFCVNPPGLEAEGRDNTYAAWPSMRGLGRFYEFVASCRGEIDPATGYFLNIKDVDEAVRTGAVPLVTQAVAATPETEPVELMPRLFNAVSERLGGCLTQLRWNLTPFYSVSVGGDDMTRAIVRQSFEFAASHRLHCADLSDDENRRLFGKCNWPSGHGHNYRVEVAVRVPTDDTHPFDLPALERVVRERVIDRFDHKHLNVDCAEFASLNPSVENIAKVCFELLDQPLRAGRMELEAVTVWETEKTAATFARGDRAVAR